jgi:hypothetical protein
VIVGLAARVAELDLELARAVPEALAERRPRPDQWLGPELRRRRSRSAIPRAPRDPPNWRRLIAEL